MITRRAVLVLVVGLCFYLIALVNVLPSFYYALTWLMAGMLVSSMGLALMSLSGLQCQWRAGRLSAQEVLEDHDEESAAPTLLLEFGNRGTLNKTGVILEVWLRDQVRKNTFKRLYLLEALASGNRIATEIPLLQLPRGEYQLQELRMVGSDVLGLFRIVRSVFRAQDEGAGEAFRFVVGPALLEVMGSVSVPASASSWSGPGSTKWGQHSDEIRGIRAYAPGDDLRDVHWKSTARTGQLVVKEFSRPLEQRMLVVWDGELNFNRQQDALEWSLRFCASLVHFAIEKNIPCSLLCLEDQSQLLGDVENRAVPLTISSSQRVLARALANRLTPLAEAMQPYLPSAARYGQLYLITSTVNKETLQVLAHWRAAGGSADVLQIDVGAFGKTVGAGKNSSDSPGRFVWPAEEGISYSSARKMLERYIQNYSH